MITIEKSIALENDTNIIEPFIFFSNEKYGKQLPILSRIARDIFQCSATSGDVERIFSKGGIVCSDRRNKLKPDTISDLIFLHGVYKSNLLNNHRSNNSIQKTKKFISLASKSVILKNDGDSFLDTLCSWYWDIIEAEDDEDDEDDENYINENEINENEITRNENEIHMHDNENNYYVSDDFFINEK